MKRHMSKLNSLKRVGLLALLALAHSHIYCISGANLLSFTGNIALKGDMLLNNYLDKNNKTASTENTIAQLEQDVKELLNKQNEITRAPEDAFLGDALDFSDYVTKLENAIIYAFKKNKGKTNVDAFIQDLEGLNIENAFITCKAKLEKIKAKAITENNPAVIEIVEKLIKAFEIKRKAWNSKLNDGLKKLALLTALQIRMHAKN